MACLDAPLVQSGDRPQWKFSAVSSGVGGDGHVKYRVIFMSGTCREAKRGSGGGMRWLLPLPVPSIVGVSSSQSEGTPNCLRRSATV